MEILFHKRLRELRRDAGLYQLKLAKILHVRASTVSGWELGRNRPGYEILIQIADFFDVTVDYLIGRTDDFERRLD